MNERLESGTREFPHALRDSSHLLARSRSNPTGSGNPVLARPSPRPATRLPCRRVFSLYALGFGGAPFVALTANPVAMTPPAGTGYVAPTALQDVLPVIEGWTRGALRAIEVDNPDCRYTFASALYTKDDTRLK